MSFKDIRGHQAPIEFLQSAIRNERLSHAYLFVGPESIGKLMTAKTLAKAANCQRHKLDSCDECISCRKIDKNIHPDVNYISPEGAGNAIRIGKIRWLRSSINLTPYEGRIKFYIIDDAHRMNDESSNAILKTLEEPPPNSILILISEKLERLFYTVRSRCQILRFKPMSPDKLEEILKDDYKISGELSHFLSYYSSGRIGKAISLKDKDAIAWKNEVIDKFTKDRLHFDEEELVFENDREKILEALNILATWYRDLLVLKSAGAEKLVINKDRIEDLNTELEKFSKDSLLDVLDEIKKASFYIEKNVNPKLTLSFLMSQTET